MRQFGCCMRLLRRFLLGLLLTGGLPTPESAADQIEIRVQGPTGFGHVTIDAPGIAAGQPFVPSDVARLLDVEYRDFLVGPAPDILQIYDPLLVNISAADGVDASGTVIARVTASMGSPSLITLLLATGPGTPDQYFTTHGAHAGASSVDFEAPLAHVKANYLHWAKTPFSGVGTFLEDNPVLNHDTDDLVFVTANWNPGSASGIYMTDPPLALLDGTAGLWSILALAMPPAEFGFMPPGAAFNVMVMAVDVFANLQNRAFVHTVAAPGPSTALDHPRLNGDPNAHLLVRQRAHSGAPSAALTNVVPSYNATTSRWELQLEGVRNFLAGAEYNVYVGEATPWLAVAPGSNFAYIDDPRLNGNPRALIHTQRTSLPTAGGWEPTGVFYDTFLERWSVFHQDTSVSIDGDTFDLFVFDPGSAGFETDRAFEHGLLINYFNEELAHATHTATVGEVGNVVSDELLISFGTFGDTPWYLSDPNGTALPSDGRFHGWVPPHDMGSFGHQAAAGNLIANATILEHPLTDGDPNAIVFATPMELHVSNPPYPGNVGVQYFTPNWEIFREDGAAMSAGPRFAYYIAGAGDDAFQHVTTSGTISGDRTELDHPRLNDHPTARLIVNHAHIPSLPYFVHDHPLGTRYDPGTGRWSIRNRDGASMLADRVFNVLVLPAVCGDVDAEGRLIDADTWLLRNVLIGNGTLSPAGQARCSVIGTAGDCNIADWAVMRRARLGRSLPGPAPICTAAL